MSTYSFFRNIRDLPALLSAHPTPVGIYGLPRGGTNFISAWLHYHPHVFCVSERRYDWHIPLWRYWRRHSLFRRDGIQDKRPSQIQRIVFNKVQRFPEMWGADAEHSPDAMFIFYLRNPIRIHMSREAFRGKHDAGRENWADSRENFLELLTEARHVLDTYLRLREDYPCLLLSHEYFCWHHSDAIEKLFRFLRVDDGVEVSPQTFFERCDNCGAGFHEKMVGNSKMLVCSSCKQPLAGFGDFNPIREIDLDDICSAKWKERDDVEDLMAELANALGEDVAVYYMQGDYAKNITIGHSQVL